MRNRCFGLFLVTILMGMTTVVEAKRSPPSKVPAVRVGDVEYRVTHEVHGRFFPGFVEAYDPARQGTVWHRQIYVIRRDPQLEGDVQDVFITGLKSVPERKALEITNEAGGRFELDLKTLEVKTLAGSAVLGR